MSTSSRLVWPVRRAAAGDFPALAGLWRRSVEATHDFLLPGDVERIGAEVEDVYLPGVGEVWLAEAHRRPAGFLGCDGPHVQMLFVAPEFFGRGVGGALLRHARSRHGALHLEVNEQNARALRFYQRRGFEITGRSPLDNDGRPYPLLYLAWRA
ncbi:GNAT family N-acetyltransferase [uncultured Desulfovibrio sp.]|uniref:GNAT family N-acetyltransferase n=1 Tax=uncultured Desulfovibrio sp. TaxID=167968 RepID=UPI0026107269|nr:GNAT family N-acetyltransferase [uncultured Desulfovibrio sp.]